MGTSADGSGTGCDAPQPHVMLPVSQEAGDPLISGSKHCVGT